MSLLKYLLKVITAEEKVVKPFQWNLGTKMHVDKNSEIKVVNITDDEEVIENIIVECNQFEIVAKSIFVASEKPVTWREKYCMISDISLTLGTLEILKFFGK